MKQNICFLITVAFILWWLSLIGEFWWLLIPFFIWGLFEDKIKRKENK